MSLYIDNLVSEGVLDHKSWRTQTAVNSVSNSTLTLTVSSESTQVFLGQTAGQILKMPDATTLLVGYRYWLINDSTQNLSVQDNGANALFLLGPSQRATLICTSTGSAAGAWSFMLADKNATGKDDFTVTYPGTGLAVNYTGGVARFNNTIAQISAGTITLPGSTTNGYIYVDIDGVVKSSASLPNNAVQLYLFTTSSSLVTALTDVREEYEQNLVWGVQADIQPVRYNSSQQAGVLEKYARADHQHQVNLLLAKAGQISAGTFTGSPKKASVTFSTAFPSANYAVAITGSDGRSWIIESQSASGFTINSQANTALTGTVYWQATLVGESQ